MTGLLLYVLEVAIITALMYGFYHYIYFRLSYYKWDRFFLIFCILISLLLPKLKVEWTNNITPKNDGQIVDLIANSETATITIMKTQTLTNKIKQIVESEIVKKIVLIIAAIYITGVLIKTIKIIKGFINIAKLNKLPSQVFEHQKIITTKLKTVGFSFFNKIYVGEKFKTLTDEEKQAVVKHEQTHIKGLHSVDRMLFNLFEAFQWFNPYAKKLSKTSRTICENIVDSQTAQDGTSTQYAKLLLKLSNNKLELKKQTNSEIKSRIAEIFSNMSAKTRKKVFWTAQPVLISVIIGYILFAGIITPQEKQFKFVFKNNYRITAKYFENNIYQDSLGQIYKVSHKQTSIKTTKQNIAYSPTKGRVEKIEDYTYKNKKHKSVIINYQTWQIEIRGLDSLFINENQNITKNQKIGIANQNNDVSIITKMNGQIVDPEKFFEI